ncbi:hypothetical protein B9G55_19105 [Saccharibacillus sp. O16]|nr:hypothetical protein B9G55_19105 [Saccharibacillus sp. O16]
MTLRFSKKMLASLLAVTSLITPLSVSADTTTASTKSFKDLEQAGSWSRDSILQAQQLELFEGNQEGDFRPNEPITRQEMAKILMQLLNLPMESAAALPFRDVPSGQWSARYIEAVSKAGIMQGYGDGTFGPSSVMTREQLAIVFVKALGLPLEADRNTLNSFQDVKQIHDWSASYVAAALKAGLMTGSGSTFGPSVKANRQETAIVAVRAHKQKQQAVQPEPDKGSSTVSEKPNTSTPAAVVQPGTSTPVPSTSAPVAVPAPAPAPAPSSGDTGGSPAPTVPTPIEQSLPAVVVSKTLDNMDFQNTFPTYVVLVSEPIDNLDFNIEGVLASASSKALLDSDFISNPKSFTISDGRATATIELPGYYPDLREIVDIINQQLTSEHVDASAKLGQDPTTIVVSRESFAYGGKLTFGGTNVNDFFANTTYESTISSDHSTIIELAIDEEAPIVIHLDKKYRSLTELASSITQTPGAPFFAVAADPKTIEIYFDQPNWDKTAKVTVTANSDSRLFKPGTYVKKEGEVKSKSFQVSDGTSTTTLLLDEHFYEIQELTDALNLQLERSNVQAFAEPVSSSTFKIVSRAIGRQANIQINEFDADQFFEQKQAVGSGPNLDQAPLIGGVPVRSQAQPFISSSSLTPVSADTDITDVELVRSTQSGIDYSMKEYLYPVENYKLGEVISEEGSYRLTVKDQAGHQTVTYFLIDKTVPTLLSVTQKQHETAENKPYIYDQGDQITFTLNTFVQKYDSQDQLKEPMGWVDIFMLEALEDALKQASPSSDERFTFGSGATLSTDVGMPNNSSYGRTFTVTLGSDAVIPSTGVPILLGPGSLVSRSGVRPSEAASAVIPALYPPL